MVQTCCIEGCKSSFSKNSGVSFHMFPVDPIRRKEWTLAIGRRNFTPRKYSAVCSKHFVDSDFERLFPTHVLKKTATPCKNNDVAIKTGYSLPVSPLNTEINPDCISERNNRIVKASAIPLLQKASQQLLKIIEKKATKNSDIETRIDCSTSSSNTAHSNSIEKKFRYVGDFKEDDLCDCENVKLMWQMANRTIAMKNRQLKNLRKNNQILKNKLIALRKTLKLGIQSQKDTSL